MIKRTGKSDTAVVGWGRGMGHKGHMLLARAVIVQAANMGADPYFFVSRTVGADDPLYPEEKLYIYKKVFPKQANIFQSATDNIPDINRLLTTLAEMGYRNAVLVVGADQVRAFQYLVGKNKAGETVYKTFGLDNLQVIKRQDVDDAAQAEEGPRATPMRDILKDPNASEEQKFAVWRDAMPNALSDKEVLTLMQKAAQRMGEFKPATKKAKIKEFIQRVRPMLKEASVEKKVQVLKLLKEAYVREFDASDYKQRYTLYVGDAHNTYKVDTFSDLDDAIQEVEFLRDADPSTVTSYWQIRDINGEVVWNYDPGEAYDAMRSGKKIQFKKPDQDLPEDINVDEDDDSPAMTPSGVPWQGPKLNREVITPPEGTEWRFGKNAKEDPRDRDDARHFGRFLSSVPNPVSKIGGALMQYAGQNPKDPVNVRVAKSLDSAGSPDEIGRYLNKKSVKEQGVAEAEQPYDLPQRHAMDYGMRKTMIHRLAKATDYEISALSLASDEELTDLYKQVFPDQDINEDYLDEK